eukprot:1585864-Pyramimonas_sp.AAC.1
MAPPLSWPSLLLSAMAPPLSWPSSASTSGGVLPGSSLRAPDCSSALRSSLLPWPNAANSSSLSPALASQSNEPQFM